VRQAQPTQQANDANGPKAAAALPLVLGIMLFSHRTGRALLEFMPPAEAEQQLKLGPRLIVVTGQAGSGKTTLAHRLAAAVGCPAICRDEIKEGMVHAHGPGFQSAIGDPLTRRTYPLFFAVLRLLLDGGVTVVEEAAFQHHLWERGLSPLVSR